MKVWIEHDRLYCQVFWRGGQRIYALDPPRDLIPGAEGGDGVE